MSPTLKKIRKQYIDYKEKEVPLYLKTYMFFLWFLLLSIILVFEPGSEPNSLPLFDQIENPSNRVGIKVLSSFIIVAITMLILRRRWIVKSKKAQIYLGKIFASFTTEGQKMLKNELKSTRPYLQIFSTITGASAFILSIFSLILTTTSKVVTVFTWNDIDSFINIVGFLLAFVVYGWIFLISGLFYDSAYKEIEIILREIEYGKKTDNVDI